MVDLQQYPTLCFIIHHFIWKIDLVPKQSWERGISIGYQVGMEASLQMEDQNNHGNAELA